MKIHEYAQIDSTNEEARRHAASGCATPALFVAEAQSAGRGRMGRSFYSPEQTGLYMSLLIDAPKSTDRMVALTAISAVAATDAIKSRFGIDLGIKWVNDLYLNSKKVAGILAESFVCGTQRYVVIGIGFNLCTDVFPDELAQKAGSLSQDLKLSAAQKTELACDVAERIINFSEHESLADVMKKYRSRSCVIGKKISYTAGTEKIHATALDITDSGALFVRLDDGSTRELSSGEISIFLN